LDPERAVLDEGQLAQRARAVRVMQEDEQKREEANAVERTVATRGAHEMPEVRELPSGATTIVP
jgi:hypothetical protein